MAQSTTAELLEALASEIGENVFMDIAKWHLYLENARLHTVLAEQLYPLLTSNTLQEDRVMQVLNGISVKLGGGKRELPLADLIPLQGQATLMEILRRFLREL
ncbi:MAG: DUF3181 family protein [Leptolyngbyaceae cyanobacterium bins.59]|nr:DUF3181 family protein [Leptolyngbyaceae cyanobacterium bins.59]